MTQDVKIQPHLLETQGFQVFTAPAKINLFLHIVGQREDGYHLLQTVFRLLDFYDTIYLKPRQDGAIRRVTHVEGVPEQNDLCVRAASLLQRHTTCSLGVDIAIEKNIPMGGGLGGGSSDAATILLALNRLWNLHLPRTELLALGLQLGADVPIFVYGKNAWAEGVGEKLQPISLSPAYYVVLTPPVHVSTAQIFASRELTRDTVPTTIAAFSRDVVSGKGSEAWFHNDFESLVARQQPAVAACLKWLSQYKQARMSGSGASVFAEFENEAEANQVLKQALEDAELKKLVGSGLRGFMARGLNQHPLSHYAD
ncbi:MAG: 4-(cytidine 5'-diphospho)-2-C-methyl-D-erythritol kinase [Methylophilaceae bacterium]|nr:4-(cytidine 5'-diphospho)-2-C-methyl-D-erythritol kinase [Methylophilaceae bacterium]